MWGKLHSHLFVVSLCFDRAAAVMKKHNDVVFI